MSMNDPMKTAARRATVDDLPDLLRMYGELSAEQSAIRGIWPTADGLDAPIESSLISLVNEDHTTVIVGEIDGVTVGFLVAIEEPLLEPMTDRRIGVVQFIFTDHEARGVGVGAAMLDLAMERLEGRGIDLFDARVEPGTSLGEELLRIERIQGTVDHHASFGCQDRGFHRRVP